MIEDKCRRKLMQKHFSRRVISVLLAVFMLATTVILPSATGNYPVNDEETALGVNVELIPENGNESKSKPGEKVTARVEISTSFMTYAGQILVSYDTGFFAVEEPTYGYYVFDTSDTDIEAYGYTTDTAGEIFIEFVTPLTPVKYTFDSFWVDIPLAVLASPAQQSGSLSFVNGSIAQSADDSFGKTNFPIVDSVNVNSAINMWDWNSEPVVTATAEQVTAYNTVKFASGDDNAYVNDSSEYDLTALIGSEITAPTNVSFTGHVLTGWSNGSESLQGNNGVYKTVMPYDDNVVYTAQWELQKVTVTYVVNGETVNVSEYEYGDLVYQGSEYGSTLTQEVKYWCSDPECQNRVAADLTATGDITLYGQLQDKPKKVATFWPDVEGTANMEPISANEYKIGEQIIAPAQNPAKEGYKFVGWSDTVGVMGQENIDFYPLFEIDDFDAIFKINKNDSTPYETISIEYGKPIDVPADPEKEGYVFEGWLTEQGLTPAQIGTMPASAVTFIAQWETDEFDVNYYIVGDDNTVRLVYSAPYEYGSEVYVGSLIGATVTKEVKKWYKAIDTATFELSSPAESGLTAPAYTLNLYGRLENKNSHIAFFHYPDGSVIQNAYGIGETIATPAVPVDGDKIFAGWTPEIGVMGEVDIHFYPVFEDSSEYEARFYNKDGSALIEAVTVFASETLDAPEAPDVTGYTFSHWSRAIGGETVDISSIVMKKPESADEFVFYAVYTANKYPDSEERNPVVVRFDLNNANATWKDGTQANPREDVIQTYDSALVTPEAERYGYTFSGWNTQANGGGSAAPAVFNSLEEVTYFAQWTPTTKTDIVFDANGGSFGSETTKTVSAVFDGNIVFADIPVRLGYYFAGWMKNSKTSGEYFRADANGVVDTLDKAPQDSLTYYAKWDIISYVWENGTNSNTFVYNTGLGFFANGSGAHFGDNVNENAKYYTIQIGDDIKCSAEPVRTGYDFAGWNTKADGKGENLEDGKVLDFEPTDHIAYYAQWTAKVYGDTVTFNAKGGTWTDGTTGNTRKVSQTFGENMNVPGVERTGYEFNGWRTDSGDQMPEKFTSEDNVTYNAQWTAKEYPNTVKFNVNGGAWSDGLDVTERYVSQTFDSVMQVPGAQRTGYTLEGWNTKADGTGEEMPATFASEEKVTYYAVWNAKLYDLVYRYDSGSGYVQFGDTFRVPADTSAEVINNRYTPAGTPEREGFYFVKWTDITAMPAANVTRTAELEKESYILKFDTNSKFNGVDDLEPVEDATVSYGDSFILPALERTGYTLSGWYMDGELYGLGGQNITIGDLGYSDASVTASKTLTAQWTRITYTLSFRNTGDTAIDSQPHYYRDALDRVSNPTKYGYDFTGWNPDYPETMPARDVTLEAQWQNGVYNETVAFNANTGAWSDNYANQSRFISQTFDTGLRTPADENITVSKEGYNFIRWNTKADGTGSNIPQNFTSLNAVTYYAIFEEKGDTPYTVNYFYMKADGTYAAQPDSSQSKTGKTNATVTLAAVEPVLNGNQFTLDREKTLESMTVAASGDMEYDVYIARVSHNAVFNVDGVTTSVPYLYGAVIAKPDDPTKENNDFLGWASTQGASNADVSFTTGSPVMGEADVTYYAVFKPSVASYKISYYFENASGEYIEDPTKEVTVSGKTIGSTVTTEGYKTAFENYEYVTVEGLTKESDVLAASGTQLKLALGRKAVNYYITVKVQAFDNENNQLYWTEDTDASLIRQAKWGTSVTVNPADFAERAGYSVSNSSQTFTISADSNNPTTFTVEYALREYTIKYYSTAGLYDSNSFYYTQKVVKPSDPVLTGHTFKGWAAVSGSQTAVPETMPAENLEFEAQWDVVKYTITYYVDGSVYKTAQFEYNAQTSAVEDPVKQGYTFKGWYNEASHQTQHTFGLMPARNIDLFADFTVKSYTITFKNGDSVIDTLTFDFGAVTAAVTSPDGISRPAADKNGKTVSDVSKEGYNFTGWCKDKEGKTAYTFTTMPAENLTVYAGFDAKTVNVYFDWGFDNKGQEHYAVLEGKYGEILNKPADPTRTGYNFTSWDAEVPGTFPANDTTFTAQWEKKTFILHYELNGADITTAFEELEGKSIEFGDIIPQPAQDEGFGKSGSRFAGWYKDASLNNEYESGETAGDNGQSVINLYAKWSVNGYNLIVDLKDCDESLDNIEKVVEYGDTAKVSAAPDKEGYDFDKWIVPDDVTVADVTAAAIEFTMPSHDVTVKATYKKHVYEKVVFIKPDANQLGAAVVYPEDKTEFAHIDSVEFGAAITAPEQAPQVNYFTFTGWYTDPVKEQGFEMPATMPAVQSGEILYVYPHYERVKVTLQVDGALSKADGSDAKLVTNADGIITSTETAVDNSETFEYNVYYIKDFGYGTSVETVANQLNVIGNGRLEIRTYYENEFGVDSIDECGTGSTVDVIDNVTGRIVERYYLVIFGDVNGDSVANYTDASFISAMLKGNYQLVRTYQILAANTSTENDDGENVIDRNDIAVITAIVAGKIMYNTQNSQISGK